MLPHGNYTALRLALNHDVPLVVYTSVPIRCMFFFFKSDICFGNFVKNKIIQFIITVSNYGVKWSIAICNNHDNGCHIFGGREKNGTIVTMFPNNIHPNTLMGVSDVRLAIDWVVECEFEYRYFKFNIRQSTNNQSNRIPKLRIHGHSLQNWR